MPEELHTKMKTVCALMKTNINQELLAFMKKFVKDNEHRIRAYLEASERSEADEAI